STYLTYDGRYNHVGRRGDDTVTAFKVRGRARIAVDADAVMLNVTAIFPDGPGFLTLYPCGQQRPIASSVNYSGSGMVVANAVLVRVGNGGNVCLYTSSATDIAIDIAGYVPHQGQLNTVFPARVLETRQVEGFTTVDGQAQGIGRVAADSDTSVLVAGRAGVPDDAESVFVNVTAVFPDGPGFLTVYPCGSQRPQTSNVNYEAGQVVPNSALVRLGDAGAVCIYSLTATDIVVDVSGFARPVATTETLLPARLLETRRGVGNTTIDGLFEGVGRAGRDTVLELDVAGRGGVPADAQYALLNVTAVSAERPGFITVYPCDAPKPFASNVNYAGRDVRPNAVLAKLSATGTTCVFTTAATDVLVDVTGYGRFDPSAVEALRRALTENTATTRGTPTVGVFVCLVPTVTTSPDYDGTASRNTNTAAELAATANQFVTPYFDAMSNGRFVPTFVSAGTITLSATDGRDDCLDNGEDLGDAYDLPVAFDNVPDHVNGQIGLTSIYTQGGAARPGGIWVSGLAVANDEWATLSHEIGHALFWRHSRSNNGFPYGDHYDVMGWTRDCQFAPVSTPTSQCTSGQTTQAFNRFASGWIDEAVVAVHSAGIQVYTIGAADSGAMELLIAPTDVSASQALAVETRIKSGYDIALDRDGVIVRFVDGMERQMAFAATSCSVSLCDRVLDVGDSVVVNGLTIDVTERTATTFTLQVSGTYTGRVVN
ncbi:MAG TPA: hypothetical protein VMM60_13240, partial [Ilumatobacter sp.]|nr:hypothetical protein [Ilumatobacter sp.]